MISIARDMDEYDIAQEIRLERQIHKGAFLLLEGQDDLKRFSKFVDDALCSTVNCFGKRNLVGAIEILYDEGFPGALGLADADFDRILNTLRGHEGLIYSESHDFDLDWACTAAVLERYLKEVASESKCQAMGGLDKIISFIFISSKPLSILRYVNHYRNLRYKLSQVNHHIVAPDGEVELDILVDHVSSGAFSAEHHKAALRNLVVNHLYAPVDWAQMTNGHDFCAMLGIALQKRIGDRKTAQTWGSEIQLHFRLAYGDEGFAASNVFVSILRWQYENRPYVVLKARLTSGQP
jgi:hypothetical protein